MAHKALRKAGIIMAILSLFAACETRADTMPPINSNPLKTYAHLPNMHSLKSDAAPVNATAPGLPHFFPLPPRQAFNALPHPANVAATTAAPPPAAPAPVHTLSSSASNPGDMTQDQAQQILSLFAADK